jgi:IS30 family transposase
MGRLSESERSVLWDLWEAGESQRSISRRLGRSPSTVRTQLVSAGWRRPTRPVERSRPTRPVERSRPYCRM